MSTTTVLAPEAKDTCQEDNLRNCRNCRWHRLNPKALVEGGPCGHIVYNCTNPAYTSNDPIQDWIDANLDDIDLTGMPTHARDCPGWAP